MQNSVYLEIKIQKFIKRLYSVTNDSNVPEITWGNNGTTFIIQHKENFKKNAMHKISKAKEYTAFVRLLHHYNFTKLKRLEDDSDEYYHKCFIKGREDLLPQIVRVKDKNKGTLCEIEGLKGDLTYMHNAVNITNQNLYNVNSELMELKNKVEKQEQTINGLIEVLSKAFRAGFASESSPPSLKGNVLELNDVLGKNEGARKMPKLEDEGYEKLRKKRPSNDKLVPQTLSNFDSFVNNDQGFNNNLHLTNNLSGNGSMYESGENKKNEKKVTEIKTPVYQNMPDLNTEEEDTDDIFNNLFY